MDSESGELGERRIDNREGAEQFYRELKQRNLALTSGNGIQRALALVRGLVTRVAVRIVDWSPPELNKVVAVLQLLDPCGGIVLGTALLVSFVSLPLAVPLHSVPFPNVSLLGSVHSIGGRASEISSGPSVGTLNKCIAAFCARTDMAAAREKGNFFEPCGKSAIQYIPSGGVKHPDLTSPSWRPSPSASHITSRFDIQR